MLTLCLSAISAVAADVIDDVLMYDSAIMLITVTSHSRDELLHYGIKIMLSDHLPSVHDSPVGALTAGIPVLISEHPMTSFNTWQCCMCPEALQLRL
jgi:hypothetical protein